MLEIFDTIVSFELFEQRFLCDLNTCKGICCVEGDAGAPLEAAEIGELEQLLPTVWDDLTDAAKAVIEAQGVSYFDPTGEAVTSIVNGRECIFTYFEEDGTCKCAIEKAYREGRSDFYKPISCHLYPVRLTKYSRFTAVDFHRWEICRCAEVLGCRENVPVYRFLREPLIRRFGAEWYAELEHAAEAYEAEFSKV